MPSGRRTAADFDDIVYDAALGPFLHSRPDASQLILMEDGAPIHRSSESKNWRDRRELRKLANSLDLNPTENVWKLFKDAIQKKIRPQEFRGNVVHFRGRVEGNR